MRTKSSEQNSLPPATRKWNTNKHIINTGQMFPVYILNLIIRTIFGTYANKYWDSWILTLFAGYHFTRYCLSVRQICKFILSANKSHLIKQPMQETVPNKTQWSLLLMEEINNPWNRKIINSLQQ